MRIQSKAQLRIRNKVIGGPMPLICLPLVAEDRTALTQQAEEVISYQPDVLEWRVDKYKTVLDIGSVLQALVKLRKTIGEIPLIFTCRIIEEGGFQEIGKNDRLALIEQVIASNMIDLVDTEISNGEIFIKAVKKACSGTDVKLILSYHNFEHTPDEDFIVSQLSEAATLGADVAKAAAMPESYGDVLTLLRATYRARTELLDIPIITMSMGEEGGITRIAGGLFGADLTFAIGKTSSAPGQIPIGDIRKAWEVLPYGTR